MNTDELIKTEDLIGPPFDPSTFFTEEYEGDRYTYTVNGEYFLHHGTELETARRNAIITAQHGWKIGFQRVVIYMNKDLYEEFDVHQKTDDPIHPSDHRSVSGKWDHLDPEWWKISNKKGKK
jgi:hypothetical protein